MFVFDPVCYQGTFFFIKTFYFEATSRLGSAGTGFHAVSQLISLTTFDLDCIYCLRNPEPAAMSH